MAREFLDVFNFSPVGAHQDGTAIAAATTLTPPSGARKMLIQTTVQNVRITLDGSDPTSTKGFRLVKDDPPVMILLDPEVTVRVIEEAATADIQYQFGV